MIGRLLIGGLILSGVLGGLIAAGMQVKPEPTIQQWYNRFIEYVEGDSVAEATKRFSALVLAGMKPEEAFHKVVNL